MIILSRGSLTKTGRFAPETMALNLCERGSTATITYKVGTASLTVGDWLQDDTDPGAGIVWRVKTIDTQYNTQTVTVQLEDMINSLNDQLLNGEVKPSDMGGSTNCTALQAITYVLNRQSVWTLNNFDYSSVSNPYSFNGDSLKSAIEIVSGSLTDPVWSYDFSSYPFKLNITQLSGTVDSEMRMSRNITTLKKTEDRSRMYTRFYPIGKNNLRPDSPQYYEKNVSTYGLIEKTETDESKKTKSELASWAAERLNAHAEPMVTVSISGLDLSEATGEALDSFTIGKKCRVPLPEYNTTITEKVTKLSWRDKLADPESVTVTLANQQEDVASIINRISKSSGRAGRTKAKDEEEDHAWIVDTTEKVALVAEAVAGKDGSGNPDWSRVAQLTVDGNGIDARVTLAEGNIVTAQSRITQTENNISLVVEGSGSSATIKAASIVAAVNSSGSSVIISADHINLNGYVKATDLTANYISGILLHSNTLSTNYIFSKSLEVGTGTFTINGYNCALEDGIHSLRITQSGNTYTLQQKHFYSSDWSSVGSFSRATSLSGEWSGSVAGGKSYKVTASPQGDVHYSPALDQIYYSGSKSWASDYKSFDQLIKVCDEDGVDLYQDTLTFDTTASWQAGYDSAGGGGDVNAVKVKPFTANSVSSLVNYRTFTYTTDAPSPAAGTSQVDTWFVVHAGLSATTSGNDKIQPGTLKAELRYGTSTGTTYARRNFTINHVELWTKTSPTKVTTLTISSETEFYPWCMVEGEWLRGDKVTITPSGGSHSPTIDQVWTSQSIPSGATQLNSLKTQYELAKADSDNFCIRVACGGTKKTYYCTP